MKSIKVFISTVTIISLMYTNAANAEPWHGPTKITTLYPSAGGYNFMVESALTTHSSCDHGKRFSISMNHVNYEAMVSTLMTAFASDKKIYINLDHITQPTCEPTINRFMVIK